MSESKLISPLLDGFMLGAPLSDHDGIRCCPAIKENSEEKYIVKIISVPATQAQMDAFILAGAYKDAEEAMPYFHKVAQDVLEETNFLKEMARLEGFTAYEGCQMQPIQKHRLGYEVYLVGTYKRSLEKQVRKNPMTHLEAMNMALDMCSALNVCRQAGSVYADLKPSNIYVTDNKSYKIGDLGFISIRALKYTALPKKYLSPYSPPELGDPMESVNLTVDTYALGMILYQLYNEGSLPEQLPGENEVYPAPVNADYELSEIILKAIHPDPQQRWTDPGQMGQAIVAYMQRNEVNDTPITPYTPIDPEAQNVQIPREDLPVSNTVSQDTTVFPTVDSIIAEQATISEDTTDAQTAEVTEGAAEVQEQEHEAAFPVQEETAGESDDVSPAPAELNAGETEVTEPLPDSIAEPESVPEEPDPAENAEPSPYTIPISDELSHIFSKVDTLVAHETPVGVVLPEIPEPADPFAFATEDSIEVADLNTPFDPVMEDKESRSRKKKKNSTKKFLSQERKKKIKRFFVTMLFLAVFAGFALLGFWYYQNVYLQTIDSIEIDGGRNQVTVTINTRADDSLLIVSCFDNYGNSSEASVTNGQAVFSNLLPNTMYTVAVSIDGFHDLVGHTSEVFTTDTTTRILSFTAVTGTEDGSAIISFTVDGDEPEEWVVSYYAEGEDPKTQEFSGHSATITGLTLGKLYNFTLDAGSSLSLSGTTTMTFVPTRLILAENLTVSTSSGSDLVIHWNSPGDTVVESWNVRVYDDADYEYSETVTETEVHLSNINPEKSYTVEVTASGMTQPARASITANPIIITNLEVDDSASDQLTVRWDYSGAEPEGGWLLMYSIDGNVNINVIKCNQAAAVIAPKLPEAKYEFTVQAVDGTSIFDNTHLYTCPAAPGYNANGVTQEQITAYLLKTPSDPNWTYDRVGNKGFTDQFKLGDPISIVLYGSTDFYLPGTEMKVLYVIRDSHGNVIPDYVTEATEYWRQIWYSGNYHYGELDLPITPEVTGTYQLNIYFDGAAIAEVTFTVS